MSEKQMEKNLDYGDCNNLFCFFSDLLANVGEKLEKSIDATVKKD
jgi:hypothetical protein